MDNRRSHRRNCKLLTRVRGKKRPFSFVLFSVFTLLLCPAVSAHAKMNSFLVHVKNLTDHRTDSWTFGEGVWVLHEQAHPLFKQGEQLYHDSIKVLIEQGKAHAILKDMVLLKGVTAGARFPKKTLQAGERQSFVISAVPGQRLSFAIPLLETNDKFLAPMGKGVALFDFFSQPLSLTITKQIFLWDGGSAYDEAPQQNVRRNQKTDLRMEKKLRNGAVTNRADPNPVTRLVITGEQAHLDGYRYPRVETIMFVSIKAL